MISLLGKTGFLNGLFSNNCLLKEASPKILKILLETNYDIGFQNITIRDRYKKVAVFFGFVANTVTLE